MELLAAGARDHAPRKKKKHVHAGDVQPDSRHRFADRLERYIVPLLKPEPWCAQTVTAYTAFARDVVRGVSRAGFVICTVSPCGRTWRFISRTAGSCHCRILGGRNAIKFYEAGMTWD